MSTDQVESLWERLEPLLSRVQKPARYIGCEDGAQTPDWAPVGGRSPVSWLFIYPDTYEIGLPNQGLQILYEIVNERPDALAERSYAPWVDLEAELRADRHPAVQRGHPPPRGRLRPARLQPVGRAHLHQPPELRGPGPRSGPGRPAIARPSAGLRRGSLHLQPRAPGRLLRLRGARRRRRGRVARSPAVVGDWKASGRDSREDVLRELCRIEGVYVPAAYEVSYDGADLVAVEPRWPEAPERVEKRTIADLADWPYPRQQLVPLTEVVHDRLNVEVFRGCTRGCRFCQAGMITRPVRERPAEQVRTMVAEGLRRTGYDEVALTSLSTADFSGIAEVVGGITSDESCGQVSVSLPSLRVDAFGVDIAAQLQKGRRTGLTFAPEAGTWRMRQVINKLIREEDLYEAVGAAYSRGWRRMKLYFLTGLPTETDEDTLAIGDLARRCVEIGKQHHKGASVTVSLGGFVPKPFTPFQWFGQNTVVELQRKVHLLRDDLRRDRSVQMKWHDPKATFAEGLAQSRRPAPRSGDRGGLASGRHVPGVVRVLPDRPVGRGDGQQRAVHRLVRVPPPHRG